MAGKLQPVERRFSRTRPRCSRSIFQFFARSLAQAGARAQILRTKKVLAGKFFITLRRLGNWPLLPWT